MNESKDLEKIISQALEEMKIEAGDSFNLENVNLAELGRRTGLTRSRLRTIKEHGFRIIPHGNTGRSSQHGKLLDRYVDTLNAMLSKGITNSSVCFDRIKALGYKGGKSTVKYYIADHRDLVPAKRHLVAPQGSRGRRYETGPGECFQMDWGFVKVEDSFGSTWKAACFAMVCHHCGFRYIEFFPNAMQENLFIGMVHGFMVMGIPERILTDNMMSVVTRRDMEGNPIWNHDYDEFQKALGFRTSLCKVAHPFTKGKVERLVRYMKDNFIQGRQFLNITDLNRQALAWCLSKNSEPVSGQGVIPLNTHKTEVLNTLPEDVFLLLPYIAPLRKISFDGFVNYEGRRYGVPYSYTNKVARVMRDREKLVVIDPDTGEVVVEHHVDWTRKPHFCVSQGSVPQQPKEHPTAVVRSSIEVLDLPSDDRFSRFDF